MARLQKGARYEWWYLRVWIYDGLFEGDYPCDACNKPRARLHWFHAEDNQGDTLKLGIVCVEEMKGIGNSRGSIVDYEGNPLFFHIRTKEKGEIK